MPSNTLDIHNAHFSILSCDIHVCWSPRQWWGTETNMWPQSLPACWSVLSWCLCWLGLSSPVTWMPKGRRISSLYMHQRWELSGQRALSPVTYQYHMHTDRACSSTSRYFFTGRCWQLEALECFLEVLEWCLEVAAAYWRFLEVLEQAPSWTEAFRFCIVLCGGKWLGTCKGMSNTSTWARRYNHRW